MTTPQQVAQHFGVQWNSADPLIPIYVQIAAQVNTDSDASLAALALVNLQQRVLLYFKRTPGDCAGVSAPPGTGGIQIAQNLLSPTSSIGMGVEIGLNAIPVAGTILSGALLGFEALGGWISGKHHAEAVAREQQVNCAVANAFNQNVAVIDQAIASGKTTAQVAVQAVNQLVAQCKSALGSVTSGHNWGWGAGQMLEAHALFRAQWYPILAQPSVSGEKVAIAGGVALLGAKLLGAF